MKQLQLDEGGVSQSFDAAAFESRRVPLERKVILKFHHFGGFFVEYSANISLSGMFITTDSPKPVGSVFIFELWLGDEYKLVHGLGEVVWIRDQDQGPERSAGMGVQYLKMDDESRGVIERIVAEHVQKGGEVFDLDTEAPMTESDSNQPEDPEPESFSQPGPTRDELLVLDEEELGLAMSMDRSMDPVIAQAEPQRSGRGLRVAVLLAALAAALGGAAYFYSAGLIQF
jgi:uncharacterized protein (TIGR02266 family)